MKPQIDPPANTTRVTLKFLRNRRAESSRGDIFVAPEDISYVKPLNRPSIIHFVPVENEGWHDCVQININDKVNAYLAYRSAFQSILGKRWLIEGTHDGLAIPFRLIQKCRGNTFWLPERRFRYVSGNCGSWAQFSTRRLDYLLGIAIAYLLFKPSAD